MVSTRAANKDTHPGEPDMPTHRRSSSQVQYDRAQAELQLAATAQAHRAKRQAIVVMEDKMAIDEAHAVQNAAHQSVPPGRWVARPLVRTDTVLCGSQESETMASQSVTEGRPLI